MATTRGRAAVFVAPGQPLAFRECEVPEASGAEVLVQIVACTICGSDRHSFFGRRSTPLPSILGHEILGKIVALGPQSPRLDWAEAALAVGDRITWGLAASCGRCFYCARGIPQKCVSVKKYGHEAFETPRDLNGGLADYCLLYPGTTLLRVPDAMQDAVACPASCATATVAAAMEAAGDVAGRRALVFGAGMLGVTATAWLRARGAEEVMVCDPQSSRLTVAESCGATRRTSPDDVAAVVAEATGRFGVDLVIEMSGARDGVEAGLALLRLGGTMVLVGSTFPAGSITLDPETVVRRCLRIQGVHNYAPHHLALALEFLASQPPDRFSALVSDWLPLSAAEQALALPPPHPALRTGIRPDLDS